MDAHEQHSVPRRRHAAVPPRRPATPRRRSSAASRPAGPPPRRARALGARRPSCCAAVLGGLGVVLYAGLWLVLPTDSHFEAGAPGLESATRGGKRPGRVRRLRDVGPVIALAALGLGAILLLQAALGQGAVFWPIVIGARRRRPAVAAGRRGAARALARHHRPDRPGPRGLRQRRLGVVRPGLRRRRRSSSPRWSSSPSRRLARASARADGRGAARRRRPGASSSGRGCFRLACRPQRGARRAGPHPGARRRGRPPARLGAPDPGPDPEELRRRDHGRPAGPGPGARPALLAVRAGEATDDARVASALRGAAAEVEDAHGVSSTWSPSATAPMTEALRPVVDADPRGDDQRRQARGHRPGRRLRRGRRPTRSTSSSATAGPASTRTASPRTGRASATASSTGWPGTAARAEVRSTPARAPRCGCTCRGTTRRSHDRRCP